jgi:hypothetical protein
MTTTEGRRCTRSRCLSFPRGFPFRPGALSVPGLPRLSPATASAVAGSGRGCRRPFKELVGVMNPLRHAELRRLSPMPAPRSGGCGRWGVPVMIATADCDRSARRLRLDHQAHARSTTTAENLCSLRSHHSGRQPHRRGSAPPPSPHRTDRENLPLTQAREPPAHRGAKVPMVVPPDNQRVVSPAIRPPLAGDLSA